MAKGRKRTQGLNQAVLGMPSPHDRVKWAAESLAAAAVEASPGMGALKSRLASEAMKGAKGVLAKVGNRKKR